VAALGAAGAIAVTEHREGANSNVFTAPTAAVSVAEPTVVPTTTPPTGDTSTLPSAPEPSTTKEPRNGHRTWPANENGWTIVLVSYPKTNGRPAALATAARGARAGLRQVGILDSGRYASLQPGYYVVFSGIYASKADADAGVGTARGAGFGGAYSRQIAR
jgi:cell division septation protein DedD